MPTEQIPFYIPWITREDRKAVSAALESRWLTGGPKVAEFEKMFADYVGVDHAVAASSCTAALHLAMRILNLKSGDEVIVPTLTFAATANAPLFCGAKPVFADIDENTFNISTKDMLEKMTPQTKAVIPVHYGGQPCDMKEIQEIAEDHHVAIVEDCAHSLGAEYHGKQTGSLGTIGCFSFYPTKIITTIEGGMLTTNDKAFANKARMLREHAMSKTALDRESNAKWYYDITDIGYNYRLNEVQAALGLSQLERVGEGIKKRIRAAHYYTNKLVAVSSRGFIPPYEMPDRSHVFHLFTIRVRKDALGIDRDTLFKGLLDKGVQPSLHYTPLHLMTLYKKLLKYKLGMFPVAERVYKEIMSLPLYPALTTKNIDFIIAKIRQTIRAEK
jgi:dTDP-4-amino-4,6-dideoxygalactose transaminase